MVSFVEENDTGAAAVAIVFLINTIEGCVKEVLAHFFTNQYISLDYGWRGRGKGTLIQLRHFKNWEGIFYDG